MLAESVRRDLPWAGPCVAPRWSEMQVREGRCRAPPWMQVRCRGMPAAGGRISDRPSRSAMSLNRVTRLPPLLIMARRFPPQRIARHDPEVATDIGENGADPATADLGRDVPGGAQTGDAQFARGGAFVLGLGGARLARGWGGQGGQRGRLADGAADQPGLERGGAKQATGDAREDFSDVDGAEVPRDFGEVGRGCVVAARRRCAGRS